MIKSLQKRFIVTAMVAISLLLTVLLGVINVVNHVTTQRQIDHILEALVDNLGSYDPPGISDFQKGPAKRPVSNAPRPDDMLGSRYFTVFFSNEGEILFADTKHIYAVSEEDAEEIAQEVYSKAVSSGRYDQFEYRLQNLPGDKGSFAVFLDTSAQRDNRLNVLLASCGGGIFCWLLMLLLVFLLSKRAIRPIAENMEKQKQFVTNAGHEIKTPLAIIMANTDAMELHNGENKWIRNIRAQTVRLTGLMQNLLTLSKMDEDGVVLPMTEFSFSLLLEEVLDTFYEMAKAKRVSVQVDLQEKLFVKANRESLMQLVSILMDNAVRYTPVNGTISVLLQKKERGICFQVKNTLDSASDIELDRLFERFYRGNAARTQETGGYGIGLSAAKAIVDAHKGKISAYYENNETEIVFSVLL